LFGKTALVLNKGVFFWLIAVDANKHAMILTDMHVVEFFYTGVALISPDCRA
jgi:hypothetical protein